MTSEYRSAFRCGQKVWGSRRVRTCINGFFLASGAGTRTLQTQILRTSLATDTDLSASLDHWQSLSGLPAGDVPAVGGQRVLDSVVVGHVFDHWSIKRLLDYSIPDSLPPQPPILASRAAYLSEWTPPERRSNQSDGWSQTGLRNLPAVSLRLWCIGQYSWIPCKILQTANEIQAASSDNHFINDLIWRASSREACRLPRNHMAY